jgi:hypothetical protein
MDSLRIGTRKNQSKQNYDNIRLLKKVGSGWVENRQSLRELTDCDHATIIKHKK